jgi:hypothetical protein
MRPKFSQPSCQDEDGGEPEPFDIERINHRLNKMLNDD